MSDFQMKVLFRQRPPEMVF